MQMPVNKSLIEQTHLVVRLGVGKLPQGLLRCDAVRNEIFNRINDLVVCYPAFYPIEHQPRLFPIAACRDKFQPYNIVAVEAQRPEAFRYRGFVVKFIEADERRICCTEQAHPSRPLLCLFAQTGYIKAPPEIEIVPSDFRKRPFDRLSRTVVERHHKSVSPFSLRLPSFAIRASQFRNASAISSPRCCRLSVCKVS